MKEVSRCQFRKTPYTDKFKHFNCNGWRNRYIELQEDTYDVTISNFGGPIKIEETDNYHDWHHVLESKRTHKKFLLEYFEVGNHKYAKYEDVINKFTFVGWFGFAAGIFNTKDEKVIKEAYRKGLQEHIKHIKSAITFENKLLEEATKEANNNIKWWNETIDRLKEILKDFK